MKLIASIYKSPKKDEMYLYTVKASGLKKVPEPLLELFGKPVHVTDILLTESRALARVDVVKVMDKISDDGFYLQMPPAKEEYLIELPQELLCKNDPV